MHWPQIYAWKSLDVSIYEALCNQNFHLHKVAYLHYLSCHGGYNTTWELLSHCICGRRVTVRLGFELRLPLRLRFTPELQLGFSLSVAMTHRFLKLLLPPCCGCAWLVKIRLLSNDSAVVMFSPLYFVLSFRSHWEGITAAMLWLCMVDEGTLNTVRWVFGCTYLLKLLPKTALMHILLVSATSSLNFCNTFAAGVRIYHILKSYIELLFSHHFPTL